MGKRKRFSATFKFNLVREALTGERTEAEIARWNGVHPVTLSKWKAREWYKLKQINATGYTFGLRGRTGLYVSHE